MFAIHAVRGGELARALGSSSLHSSTPVCVPSSSPPRVPTLASPTCSVTLRCRPQTGTQDRSSCSSARTPWCCARSPALHRLCACCVARVSWDVFRLGNVTRRFGSESRRPLLPHRCRLTPLHRRGCETCFLCRHRMPLSSMIPLVPSRPVPFACMPSLRSDARFVFHFCLRSRKTTV